MAAREPDSRDTIARQVLGYLTQFAGKASRLGSAGVVVLFVTALALVLTIDRTLNGIWRVRRPRPLGQRVLVYWAVVTLGPLLLAVSLSITSYAVSASKGLVGVMPGGVQLLLDSLQFLMLAWGMAALVSLRAQHPGALGPCLGRWTVCRGRVWSWPRRCWCCT
jgi:membrane protein